MSEYQKIMVAVDLGEHSAVVARRAAGMAQLCSATLTVLHIVNHRPPPMDIANVMPPYDEVRHKLVDVAQRQLSDLIERSALPGAHTMVTTGRPKEEIVRIAEHEKVDLIVVGAHGRHGITGLLGSTVDRVLHQASCDVLVVR